MLKMLPLKDVEGMDVCRISFEHRIPHPPRNEIARGYLNNEMACEMFQA